MDSKSLMIGDWVQIVSDAPIMTNEYHRIDWIRTGEVGLDNRKIVTYPYIRPIPLTAEILEKNGFRNIGGHWYDDAADYYELEIEAYSDSIWRVIYHNTEFNIGDERVFVSHIHELQHALRLFGIEKEIEL